MMRVACLFASILAAVAFGDDPSDPLGTPDLTGYDPVEVLCGLGKDNAGKPKIQGWCNDWVSCIKAGAQPAGDQAAVMSAWKPADCKEVCGEWPQMTPPELLQNLFGGVANNTKSNCQNSCTNFQASLSSCVATILFEPGKVAAMGLPKDGAPKAPEHCLKKDSPCMPDLPFKVQRCLGHKTKKKLYPNKLVPEETEVQCKMDKMNMEDCKDCPQMKGNFVSVYHTFAGGCMSQLHAYWQASHPGAGIAAVPGATGCKVH